VFNFPLALLSLTLSSLVPLAHAQTAGKLRGIALGGTKRSTAAPDLPLVAETLPGFQTITWYALVGPRSMPQPIVGRLNAEVFKMFADQAFAQRIMDLDQEPQATSPADLHAYIRADNERWSKVVKLAGLKQLGR
jgi:tripartite-type tricarboxylate transporter receptor subunit TctC